MKITLRDISKFIKVNNIQEITNPVIMNQGYVATNDGLLSTDIFGTSAKKRRRTYGYIDLHGHYLHPLVFKTLKRMDRRIDNICAGTARYNINKDGEIVEDDKGGTGLEWLYKNWDKIKWKKNDSKIRNARVDFLNNEKNKIFQQYEIVQPAFYRDININDTSGGKVSIHEINRPYTKLIRLASTLGTASDYNFVLENTRYQIQLTLVEIYDYFKNKISGKRGIIRNNILGKSVDYGSRLVICAPHYDMNSYKDSPVDFYYTGIPLANCCSMAFPFLFGAIKNFLMNEFEYYGKYYPVWNNDKKKIDNVVIDDPEGYFNDEMIEKLISKYINSYGERFDLIELPVKDYKKPVYLRLRISNSKTKPYDPNTCSGGRPCTLTDLMFIACENVCKDKHCYITRYPITDFMGIFTTRIRVMSTNNTIESYVNGDYYKFYPDVDLSMSKDDVSRYFIDVLRMQNSYLDAIGGDYRKSVVVYKPS